MALVNEMEMDSEEVIPQMENNRLERKQKQNNHEVEDVCNEVNKASSTEMVDTMLSGKLEDDEQKIPMEIRSHFYNVFMERQECTTFLDCPNLKLSSSHNHQLFNLVAHCLDQKDISSFLSLYNSIKFHCPPDTKKFLPLRQHVPHLKNPKLRNTLINFGYAKLQHVLLHIAWNDCQ